MGLRIWKRFRFGPVRFNLSKSGVSTSVGGRGGWLTFGKHGVRSTIGVPGSGIFWTQEHRFRQARPENLIDVADPVTMKIPRQNWLALMVFVTLIAIALMVLGALGFTLTGAAHAETYMCRVGHKSFPVTIDDDKGTMTWRGTTFRDLKTVESDFKYEWQATDNGVTASLCAATQGVADLTIERARFDCQMKR